MNSFYKKKTKANILIHFEKSIFFLGEYIKGNIEINTSSSAIIKDITIEIFLTEEWKIKEGDKTKACSDKKRIICYNLNIKSLKVFKIADEDNLILPIGLTFIPFNFLLSEVNVPCFEYPCPDKRASIRYSFIATIDSTHTSGSATLPICLLSRPIFEAEKKLSASIKQTIKKWKLFWEGDTELKVSFPENNYKYDSICNLKIEIDNTNGKITTKKCKITLIRTIIFKNQEGEIKLKECNKIVRENAKVEVKPGNKDEFEFKLSLIEKNAKQIYNYNMQVNPYNIDIEKINYFMPTVKGLLITCDYVIKVCLYFDSFVDNNHRPRILLPLYLVHQSPSDYQLEMKEKMKNSNNFKETEKNRIKVKFISKSYNEKEKNNENNKYNDFSDNNNKESYNEENQYNDDVECDEDNNVEDDNGIDNNKGYRDTNEYNNKVEGEDFSLFNADNQNKRQNESRK